MTTILLCLSLHCINFIAGFNLNASYWRDRADRFNTPELVDAFYRRGLVHAVFNLKRIRSQEVKQEWQNARWYCSSENYFVGEDRHEQDGHRHTIVVRCRFADVPVKLNISATTQTATRVWKDVECLTAPKIPANTYLAACTHVRNTPIWQILQWILYHFLHGFEFIVIFINENPENVTHGLVKLIDEFPTKLHLVNWWLHDDEADYLIEQQAAQNSCIRRLEGDVRWLMLTDIDEFPQPRHHDRFVDWVRQREKDLSSSVGALVFSSWWFFPLVRSREWEMMPTNQNRTWLAALNRAGPSAVFDMYKKCLIRPENVAYFSVHTITTGGQMIDCSPSEVRLVHYKPEKMMLQMPITGIIDNSMQKYNLQIWKMLRLFG